MLATTVGLLAGACGPSVQFIYESNIRFEHCYRLDFDPSIAPPHRRACWFEWVERFAKGQTRDRLEYAHRRIGAIDSGDGAVLALHVDDPPDAGPGSGQSETFPAPTNVHAPPPAVILATKPSPSASGGVVNAEDVPQSLGSMDAGAPDASNSPQMPTPPTKRKPPSHH